MKIYIECKGIERIVELVDLKVLDFIKNEEFYFKNKESFLEKYTDLNKEEREVLYKNEDFLKELINFFIINNNIENKYLFEKTISEFSILNNTFLGFFFYNLLKKGYTFDELSKKTNKDLFISLTISLLVLLGIYFMIIESVTMVYSDRSYMYISTCSHRHPSERGAKLSYYL